MTGRVRIGIDLGGTKIAGVAIDAKANEIASARVATPADDYNATIAAIAGLIDALVLQCGCASADASIGIGMPGSISPTTGRVQNANSIWLNGRAFAADLEMALGRPVRLANDANCLAVSEAADGAGAGAGTVFGAIIGTGCGGGFVVRGGLLTGLHAIGGEWGHNPLPWPQPGEWPGPTCWCGRHGCIETWVSGPGMARDHAAAGNAALPAHEIATAAANGDAACQATLVRHASRLARGLAHVINILDPEIIVLGGGLSNMPHLYRDLPGLIGPHVFSDHFRTAILPPKHGDASGARGAARLWDDAPCRPT